MSSATAIRRAHFLLVVMAISCGRCPPPAETNEKTPRRAGSSHAGWCAGAPSATERAAPLTRTLRPLLSLVHAQRPAIHLEAVERLDRGLRFALLHLDETEAPRLAGLPIVDQLHGIHLAVTLEQSLHVLLGGVERQIAYVNRRHR